MSEATQPKKRKLRRTVCKVCGCEYRYLPSHFRGRPMCPCPACGWIEEEPVRAMRAQLHFFVTGAATVVFIGLFIASFLGLGIPSRCLVAGIAGSLFLLAHGAVACWDPNRNPGRNVDRARDLASQKVIRDIKPRGHAPADSEQTTNGLEWRRTGLIALAALSVCAMVSAEVVRKQRGWINDETFGVIGPGESLTINFNSDTKSVGGLWKGYDVRPLAVASDVRRGSIAGLTGTTQTRNWGDEIRTSGDDQVLYPWASVNLPDRPELRWCRLKLDVGMTVTYPKTAGRETFDEFQRPFHKEFEVVLSEPYSGRSYARLWTLGGLCGAALFLLAGFGLSAEGRRASE